MEEVIREGALRLLTSETSCDVILSCHGRRMMAHKIILSIASPLLRVSNVYLHLGVLKLCIINQSINQSHSYGS